MLLIRILNSNEYVVNRIRHHPVAENYEAAWQGSADRLFGSNSAVWSVPPLIKGVVGAANGLVRTVTRWQAPGADGEKSKAQRFEDVPTLSSRCQSECLPFSMGARFTLERCG